MSVFTVFKAVKISSLQFSFSEFFISYVTDPSTRGDDETLRPDGLSHYFPRFCFVCSLRYSRRLSGLGRGGGGGGGGEQEKVREENFVVAIVF